MGVVDNKRWIAQLPMIDLHVHLDGSVKPDTLRELAVEQDQPLSLGCDEELVSRMQIDDGCQSLKEYLSKFDFVLPYLQRKEALERVAYETVAQSAAHNGKYIEVRFGPQLHTHQGLRVEDVMDGVLSGLRRGERDFGVMARGIAICMRHHGVNKNLEVVEAAAAYRKMGITAVDLAGDEASYPPLLHQEVFRRAHQLGLPITIHAGEAAGPENIHDSIVKLGARRIGHGVRAKENPRVLQLVRDQRIPLELCPVSNIQTKAVADWHLYPVRDYFDQGLMLTINTDNPTVSGTTLLREYTVLADRFGFRPEEIARLIMNSVHAAFLEEPERQALAGRFRERFAELKINVC